MFRREGEREGEREGKRGNNLREIKIKIISD